LIYKIEKNKIVVFDKSQFNATHILECGQIFCYQKTQNGFLVFSQDKKAEIIEHQEHIEIITPHTAYFEHFFDLKTDYNQIKNALMATHPQIEPMIEFGGGIRILHQDMIETIVGFIISANNNIKRIQNSMWLIRQHLGTKIDDYFAFPTLSQLASADQQFFVRAGLGYRATYMVRAIYQLCQINFDELASLPTEQLRKQLLQIAGVGPKVADCILLFAFHRPNVFPVDTWVQKIYADWFFDGEHRPEKMRENLTQKFGDLSGFAQQYLFYSKRSLGTKTNKIN
jgi:N-glycosylase/DNA lyase